MKIGIDLGGTIATKINSNGIIKFIIKQGCKEVLEYLKNNHNKLFLVSKCNICNS